MVNHRGTIPKTPGMRDMLMPTSISKQDVMGGKATSKYILLLPTCPPNSPLSVLEKRSDAL